MARKIVWSGAPHRAQAPNLTLIRTRAGTTNKGVCLSRDVLGAEVHYCGRTVPHVEPAEDCDGCKAKRQKRWEGYIAAWNPSGGKIVLLTITAGAADAFEAYAALHGSIRGAMVTLSRPGGRPNGRIVAELQPSGIASTRLPDEPDLFAVVANIWGLDEQVAHDFTHHGGTIMPGLMSDELAHELASVAGFPSSDVGPSAGPDVAQHEPLPGQKELPLKPTPYQPRPKPDGDKGNSAERFANRLNAWTRAKQLASVAHTNGHSFGPGESIGQGTEPDAA